ncbi:hypothetical protein G6F56_012856 [Rhizopus delemar]|nr:hypothetical protein G6F56_012856 [Rhizopus delemar]
MRQLLLVTAAINVTEPGSTGIGGDAFCLFYDAKTRTVKGLNGSGRTPAKLTMDFLKNEAKITDQDEFTASIQAITVPGAAAAWVDTVQHFGSGNLDLNTILTPGIDLAENGFPVSHVSACAWKQQVQSLLEKNPNQNIDWLIDNHRAPQEGEMMTVPALAE